MHFMQSVEYNRESETNQTAGQTGLNHMDSFVVKAAKSRWARGTVAVLGLGTTSVIIADQLMQNPVAAQVEPAEATPTLTPTPIAVIATAQAIRNTAEITANATRTSIAIQTAIAGVTAAAKKETTATQQAANTTATAIIEQARQDYPEWAKKEDDRKETEKTLVMVEIPIGIIITGLFVYSTILTIKLSYRQRYLKSARYPIMR